LRLGLIGCGEIAAQTAQGIAESAYAEHVMVMDIEERLAQDLGETYGVPHTTRVEELLANMAVDAVYIAVPHHLLAPLSIQAAQAGKHVLVEKPMATTLADADAAIAAARKAGVTLSVALTAQVDRDCLAIRQLIVDGAIGAVDACSAVRGQDPFEEIYRIYGDAGQIIRGSPPRIFVTNAVAGLTRGVWQDVPVAADGPRGDRVAVVDGFARAVLAGEPPPVRGEDGRAALAFITAAYQSGQEYRTIELGGGSGRTGTAGD